MRRGVGGEGKDRGVRKGLEGSWFWLVWEGGSDGRVRKGRGEARQG